MKLLVVEDEAYSRQSLVKQVHALDPEGKLTVLEASNGKRALDVVRSQRPELILSDIQMPVMNGLELLKEVRRVSPDTQVIMVSGYADFQFAQEALNQGAIGYLLKPVSDESLRESFERFLQENGKASVKPAEEKPADPLTVCLTDAINENRLNDEYILQQSFARMFVPFRVATVTFLEGERPERKEFLRELSRLFSKTLDVDFRVLTLSSRRYEVVFKQSDRMQAALCGLTELLRKQGKTHCVGVSGQHHSLSDFLTAHAEALYAEKHRLLEEREIYSFDALRGKRTVRMAAFPRLGEFTFQVRQGKAEEAYRIASAELLEMRENRALQIEAYETFLMKLQIAMTDHGEELKSPLGQQWFSLLTYAKFSELLEDLKRQIERVCAERTEKRSSVEGSVPDQVIEYIQQNYNKDLSLKDLAERVFFMNHSYLSYLIREKTGKTYSSYLREIRISHAKELLLDSHLPITDVATLSGYNDPSQFIQIFKKETGMTPRRFREESAKTGNGE